MIGKTPRHTYLLLTKRSERMAEAIREIEYNLGTVFDFLFPNAWLGVTAENQKQADARIPVLLQIPAAVRFVSVEPMLGPVNVQDYLRGFGRFYGSTALDWIICGAETGPGARPMKLDWARSLRDQCQEAGVPFFFKKDSNGSRLLDGRLWEEYPREA